MCFTFLQRTIVSCNSLGHLTSSCGHRISAPWDVNPSKMINQDYDSIDIQDDQPRLWFSYCLICIPEIVEPWLAMETMITTNKNHESSWLQALVRRACGTHFEDWDESSCIVTGPSLTRLTFINWKDTKLEKCS